MQLCYGIQFGCVFNPTDIDNSLYLVSASKEYFFYPNQFPNAVTRAKYYSSHTSLVWCVFKSFCIFSRDLASQHHALFHCVKARTVDIPHKRLSINNVEGCIWYRIHYIDNSYAMPDIYFNNVPSLNCMVDWTHILINFLYNTNSPYISYDTSSNTILEQFRDV